MILNDTHYPDTYPESLCHVLERARQQRQRVRLHFPDYETFESEGYIGRSTGPRKTALVVYNARSTGGSPLRSDCAPVKVDCRHGHGRFPLWEAR